MRRERGYILVMAVLLITAIAALAVMMASLGGESSWRARRAIRAVQVENAVANAIQWALWQAVNDPAALSCGTAGVSVPAPAPPPDLSVSLSCVEYSGITEGASSPRTMYAIDIFATAGAAGSVNRIVRDTHVQIFP